MPIADLLEHKADLSILQDIYKASESLGLDKIYHTGTYKQSNDPNLSPIENFSAPFTENKASILENRSVPTSTLPSGLGAEKYPTGIKGADINELMAQNQSSAEQILTAAYRLPVQIGDKVGAGIGYLGGLVGLGNRHSDYGQGLSAWIAGAADNAMAKYFRESEESFKERNAIYQESEDLSKGFWSRAVSDLNFWTEDAADAVAFMASSMIPTMAISKAALGARAVSGLAKLTGRAATAEELAAASDSFAGSFNEATKLGGSVGEAARVVKGMSNAYLAKGINYAASSFLNIPMEAMVESLEVRDSVLEKLNNDPQYSNLSEDEKKQRAAEAASNTFKSNLVALLPSSLWESSLIFNKLPSSTSRFKRDFLKKSLLSAPEELKPTILKRIAETGKDVFTGIATEGFYEENLQLAISRLNEEYAQSPTKRGSYLSNLASQLGNQTISALSGNDPEAAQSIGLGGIIGGGASSIKTLIDNKREGKLVKDVTKRINNISSDFKSLGNIYETDNNGSIILDEQGSPKINQDKFKDFISSQNRILELTDLSQAAKEGEMPFLANIYEKELFSRFAQAHFENGLGDILMEKLENTLGLNNEDLKSLGLDPSSKDKAAAKVAEYKDFVTKLKNAYDDIERNIVSKYETSGTKEEQLLFNQRKSELFRLSARNIITDDLLKSSNNEINNLTNVLNSYDPSYNSSSDGLVNTANQKRTLVNSANRYYESLLNASEYNRLYGEEVDEESIKAAKENLREAVSDYKSFEKDNEEELSKLKTDDNGYFKYEKRAKNTLPEVRNLKRAQLRSSELKLSRNSIIQRLSVMSNPVSGQEFFNKSIKKIRESVNPSFASYKEPLKNKTTEDYLSYEGKRIRGTRIKSQVQDIESEFIGANLSELLKNSSLEESINIVGELINTKSAIPKESLDEIKKSIGDKINNEIEKNTIEIGNLQDRSEQIQNKEAEYIEEIDEWISPALTEEENQEVFNIESEIAKRNDLNKNLSNLKKDIDSNLLEYTPSEISDNKSRRTIAEEYLIDSDQIISDMSQSDEGYDTEEDLSRANEEIANLRKLKDIFEKRGDNILNSSEFKGFSEELNNRIEKLLEFSSIIEKRVNDRDAKNERILESKINILQTELSSVDNFISDLLGPVYQATFSEAKIKSETATGIEKLGLLESMQTLISQAYTSASPKIKKEFDDNIAKAKKEALSVIENSNIISKSGLININDSKSNLLKAYSANPSYVFFSIVDLGVRIKGNTEDRAKDSSVGKYLETGNINEFKKNVENENRENNKISKEDLLALINAHIQYLSLHNLDLNKEAAIYTLAEIQSELELSQKDNLLTPSNEQLFSLRELVNFFKRKSPNVWFNNISYLKAPAGAGKTQIVGQWLPNLLGLSKEQIFAIGYNQTSSAIINKALEIEGAPIFNDLLEALKTNTKLKLIIIDEVGFLTDDELLQLSNAVKLRNETSSQEVKVVLLGDPNQLNIGTSGQIQTSPDIEKRRSSPPVFDKNGTLVDFGSFINNVTFISPLTTRFRSNVSQISNFSNKFINQDNNLAETTIITKSNNPNLDPKLIQDNGLTGVVGSFSFLNDLIKILKNSNLEDDKTRTVITNPSNVEFYKKQLLDNGITLDKVNVLSYIDVQGQTINEVYIDIKDSQEFQGNRPNVFYNKALYVATSRATDFILIANLDIQNELDTNIESSKKDQEKAIKDSKSKFKNNRELEEKTVKSSIGLISVPQKVETPKIETVTKPVTPVESFSEIAANVEEFAEDESYPEEETKKSITEKVQEFTSKVIDTTKEFVQNIKFPSFTATKNQITIDGVAMEVSDKTLSKLSGYNLIAPSIKEDDDVFYTPIARGKNIFIGVYSPEKDSKSNVVPNKYRQLGVLSTEDIESLKNNPDSQSLYDSIKDYLDNSAQRATAVISGNEYFVTNPNMENFSIAKGKVANISHMNFIYDPTNYKGFNNSSLRDIIKKFADGFFPSGYDVEPIIQSSKIIIFSNEDLKRSKDDFSGSGIVSGVPYLVLSDLKQSGARKTPKKMFIRLDRRTLNTTVHKEYLAPAFSFINSAKKINDLIDPLYDENYGREFSYGHPSINNLIIAISKVNNNTEAVDLLKENEATKDRKYTEDEIIEWITESRNLYNLWKEPKTGYISKGKLVTSTKQEFSVVQKYKRTENGHNQGDLYQAKKAGEVIQVELDKNGVTTRAKVAWSELIDGQKVDKEEWFPVENLSLSGTQPGATQKLFNQIWAAHKTSINKISEETLGNEFPKVDSEEDDDEGESLSKRKVFKAPSLLQSKFSYVDIGFYEALFNFNKEGNSEPLIPGLEFGLKIPVPRRATGIDFTDSPKNSANDSQVTSFYLQSNFEGVEKTAISVKFPKTVSKSNTPTIEENSSTQETEPTIIKESSGPSSARTKNLKRRKLDSKIVTQKELGKKLSKQQVIRKVKKIFPNLSDKQLSDNIQFIDQAEMLKLNLGEDAWGLFKDNIIYLKTNDDDTVNYKVVMHEVFHAIYNTLLTTKEKNRLEEIVKSQFPKTAFLDKADFEEFVDEHLANLYMNQPKGIHHYLKMILEKIKKFLNFTSNNIESISDLFTAIDNGQISLRFGTLDDIVENYIEDSIQNGTIKKKC